MLDEVSISCSVSGAELRLYEPRPREVSKPVESFSAELIHDGLQAEGRIDTHMANFVELFSEMVDEWPVWEGQKMGGSADMDLFFECTTDGSGHVFAKTTMRSGRSEKDWTVETTLRIDAQPLKDFTRQLRRFFRHETRTA